MKDGLYKVEFQTQLGAGAGVVFLSDGKLRGGDSRIYYLGTCAQNGPQFTAEVVTNAHTNVPTMGSVFGVDHAHITLKGTTTDTAGQMVGTAKEAPGVSFQAKLTWLAD